ncbi:MinD/ParA family protein [Craurococcus roseus]|uniref:MinD/ParA family protein n=1 Tax=Craurococcus roseus TaxID=77585 RepID=A0ABP3RFT0_9PROT
MIPEPLPSATAAAGRGGRLIAVASGKGGVGKTWLAVTLSHALALAGRRVLLVDADLGLANVDVQLGLEPGQHGLPAVLAGRVPVAEAARPHPALGFDILAGCSGSGALAGLDEAAHLGLLGMLREAGHRWDDIVLDLGAGLDRGVRALAAGADLLLVVATAEPTSLTDAYAVLKLHRRDRPGGDARLVVNQATDRVAGERTWQSLNRACASFLGGGVRLAGVLRRDPRVADAIRRQTPFLSRHPAGPLASDVEALRAAIGEG